MTRGWTKSPIVVAALGALAVLITALLLPRTTITQHTTGSNSPTIANTDGNVTFTQQHDPQPPAGQSPATPLEQFSPPQAMPPPPGQPWWQQPPVIAAIIAAIATLVAALISRARVTSPAETKARKLRRKS